MPSAINGIRLGRDGGSGCHHLSTAGPRRPRWQLKRFGAASLADVFQQARVPGSSSQHKVVAGPISGGSLARTLNPYDRLKVALQAGPLEATWGSRRKNDFEAISNLTKSH
jgi:hypothetical protein